MITEANIFLALGIAAVLLLFSVRLGISIYQLK
jgi:hypothetical protein